jgi:hypothetical protein
MSAAEPTERQRLAALVDRKLRAMEQAKKPPSLAELNGVRRLIEMLERERQIEEARRLTT